MRFTTKLAWCMATVFVAGQALAADLAVLHNGFSIRHERREVQGDSTRLYLDGHGYLDIASSQIDHFEKDLTPPKVVEPMQSSIPLGDVVASASSRHHLDPDLISSVIHAESGFNPHAVSRKGAHGLMQLMPQTASQLGVANTFDPKDNVEGGTRYLRALLEQYNFDLVKALAAYNAGPTRVSQYGGVPPYYETQAYVARIVREYNRKKLVQRKALASHQAKKINQKTTAQLAAPRTP